MGERPEDPLAAVTRRRLVVVSGKGGVGRTLVAALLGLACARAGRRVLVGTTGDDHRLAWMFGRDRLEPVEREAASGLFVQRFDPQTCIVEYGGMMAGAAVARMVLDNRVVRRFLRALPGLDDYAVLGKAWHEATRGGRYDTVVLDGPATGHLRYVLGVPRAIVETAPAGVLATEARRIQDALGDPDISCAVYVGLAEPWPLTELDELARCLRRDVGLAAGATIVNGLWPRFELPAAPPEPLVSFAGALSEMAARGRAQRRVLASHGLAAGGGLLGLPYRFGGVEGPDDLDALLAELAPLTSSQPG